MPIYEYQCQHCWHELESFEKMTDTPLTDCPACGKSTLQKLVSAAGFQLKGTGWYATDFRQKSETAPKKESTTSDKATSTDASATASTASTTAAPSTSSTEGKS